MKLSQKNDFDGGWYKTGKMNNYNCEIHYDDWSGRFSFVARNKGSTFNSLWHDMTFKTEDECRKSCEQWIVEQGG